MIPSQPFFHNQLKAHELRLQEPTFHFCSPFPRTVFSLKKISSSQSPQHRCFFLLHFSFFDSPNLPIRGQVTPDVSFWNLSFYIFLRRRASLRRRLAVRRIAPPHAQKIDAAEPAHGARSELFFEIGATCTSAFIRGDPRVPILSLPVFP